MIKDVQEVPSITGYLLYGHAKVEMPLAGSVDVRMKDRAQNVVQPFIDDIPVLQHRQSKLVTCADDVQRRIAVKSSPRPET